MLCAECEKRFGVPEAYVASVALQNDDTFPALTKTVVLPTEPDHEWKLGDASALDCAKISYFAASVVWRASVSALYSSLSLGNKYNAEFATFLLGNSSFPAHAILLLEFMWPTNLPRVDRMVVAPESQKDGTFHVYQFCMFGMWFRLLVGGVLPSSVKAASFDDEHVVLLSDGRRLVDRVVPTTKKATPKGRLAPK